MTKGRSRPQHKTEWRWEQGAIGYLLSVTDQVPIPGMEHELSPTGMPMRQSKLRSEEAKGILEDMAKILGLDLPEMHRKLSREHTRRRRKESPIHGWEMEE